MDNDFPLASPLLEKSFSINVLDITHTLFNKSTYYTEGECISYMDDFYRIKKNGLIEDVKEECELLSPSDGMNLIKFPNNDFRSDCIYCVTLGDKIITFYYSKENGFMTVSSSSAIELEFNNDSYKTWTLSRDEYEKAVENGVIGEGDIVIITDDVDLCSNELTKYSEVCLKCGAPIDPTDEVFKFGKKYIKCKYCGCANYPTQYIN